MRTTAFGVAASMTAHRAFCHAFSTDAPEIADDPLRPAFHLMPPHNWMNDPNGPIWWKGKYHLFYQLNPHAAVWGDMHWGHAISSDMVHWQHEPIALAPTPDGPDSDGCFSGSAVVMDGIPALLYTGVQNAPPAQVTLHDGNDKLRETQMLATAQDDGLLQWKKLPEPVIASPPSGMTVTGFRDPCPWREDDGWYLGIGSGERGKGGCVLLYRSRDLRHWQYLHKLAEGAGNGRQSANPCDSGEMWECPDFFEVDGHHCLLYSTEGKVIWATGEYDRQAHRYSAKRNGVLDHGAYYAPKSFLAPDGRRILWGWIQETRPQAEYAAAGWAGAMALPRVLGVTPDGQLTMRPAVETEKLRGAPSSTTLRESEPFRLPLPQLQWELAVRAVQGTPAITVRIHTEDRLVWLLTLDTGSNTARCGDLSFTISSNHSGSALRLLLDASVIESFFGTPEALTSRVYDLKPGDSEMEIVTTGGRIEVTVWPLQPISKDRLTT